MELCRECSQEGTKDAGAAYGNLTLTQSLIVSGEVGAWTVYLLSPELTSFHHMTSFVNIK